MPEDNAGRPINRRQFLRTFLLAAAGTAAAACSPKAAASEKEKGAEKQEPILKNPTPKLNLNPTPSPPPPPKPNQPSAEIKETDPKKELEKRLLEVIKPTVAEFFEKYGQDIPEAARKEFEENGDLPPVQPWADNIGGWYKSLMEYTGSDSGIYEEMTMDEWGYLMLMIDQRADAPDPNDNEDL